MKSGASENTDKPKEDFFARFLQKVNKEVLGSF